MRGTGTSWSWLLGALSVAALAASLAGCGWQTPSEDNGCRGDVESIDERTYCVRKKSNITETGFDCPEEFSHQFETDHAVVCSKKGEEIPDEHREEIDRNHGPDDGGGNSDDDGGWSFDEKDAADSGTDAGTTTPPEPQRDSKLDLLWVIDNSGSMCEEQTALRNNFDAMLDELARSARDFHLAVTTTHFARRNSPIELAPIAEGGRLQSTPSPVPFPSETCRFATDSTGTVKNGQNGRSLDFSPVKTAVDQAVTCAKEDYPELENPSDARIACALYGQNPPAHVRSKIGTDTPCQDADATKHDGRIYPNDLFPCGSQHDPPNSPNDLCSAEQMRDVYRDVPRVIRASAPRYQTGDGRLDREALEADFACMSFVGTRGNGAAEQGLKALTEAVSPEMTGGPTDDPIDDSAPNHGLIRQDADFAAVFMSDENDCSYGAGWEEYSETGDVQNMERDNCGGANCYFPTKDADDQSPLKNVDSMLDQFVTNLAESKRMAEEAVRDALRGEGEFEVRAATIDGGYEPFSGEIPAQCDDPSSKQPRTCAKSRGLVFSGDRYHDFVRQFSSHYPTLQSGLGDRGNQSRGLLCRNDFSRPLEAIGEVVSGAR